MADLYTQKAQYQTDEPVKFLVELDSALSVDLTWNITWLDRTIRSGRQIVRSGDQMAEIETEPLPAGGFGLSVTIGSEAAVTELTSAIAVAETGIKNKIIRYGFLSDFKQKDFEHEDIRTLAKYHINTIQYYDWSYRPHQYLAPNEDYCDLMGKPANLATIRHKLAWARTLGMRSIAYGAIYAAAEDFWKAHQSWGLLDQSGQPVVFIGKFFIMDISRSCPWHDHIISQYRDAIAAIGFDGIHMDTYGHPKWGVSPSLGNTTIYLEEHIPELINDTREILAQVSSDVTLIFNNVGNWPVDQTASTRQDCVYIEVWPPFERYRHIRQLILEAKQKSGRKPVVLAAYLEPFRNCPACDALAAARLLTAVIFAQGGTHLLLGERNCVLTQGYYADHASLTEGQTLWLRRYYDFGVRYQDLLYDDDLVDVGMTHACWDNVEYQCNGAPWSPEAEAGKVYVVCRQKPGLRLVSLINLCGCAHDFWNQGQQDPEPVSTLEIEVMLDHSCKKVWLATPDADPSAAELDFSTYANAQGSFVRVKLPAIKFWSLLVIE